MRTIKVTTKTAAEIDAAFEEIFKDVRANSVTQEERLAPYRKEILKLRRRGLSWRQIAEGMRKPPLNETVDAGTLRKVFEAKAGIAAKSPEAPTGGDVAAPLK